MTAYNVWSPSGDLVCGFEANLMEASASITVEGASTPYQTADARHTVPEAARLAALWTTSQDSQGPLAPGEYWVTEGGPDDDGWSFTIA